MTIRSDGSTVFDLVVWRLGKWDRDQTLHKVTKALTDEDRRQGNKGHENDDFVFYGPGYAAYNCTQVVVSEEEFDGVC